MCKMWRSLSSYQFVASRKSADDSVLVESINEQSSDCLHAQSAPDRVTSHNHVVT